jgi:glycosyltransferase involved in cell wall biosynthesis
MKFISIVIPFFNEINSIQSLLDRTHHVLEKAGVKNYECLLVDNGSLPAQRQQIQSLCQDGRTRVLSLSRNFGYQGALWAGLDHARGDPIIFMDGDGEDPPEVISDFLTKWKEGFDIVYGIRLSRKVGWFTNRCYQLFYRLLARYSNISIPLDSGEFSLISGPALTAIRTFHDRTRMLRILRAWVGFHQIGVPYHREERIADKSKFTFLKSFSFAWDGFVAATDIPARIAIYFSLLCFFGGLLGVIYYFVWHFLGHEKIPGFASLNITILFLFSMLFCFFSILARYVLTLLDETRKRPPYLVLEDTFSKDGVKPRLPRDFT